MSNEGQTELWPLWRQDKFGTLGGFGPRDSTRNWDGAQLTKAGSKGGIGQIWR